MKRYYACLVYLFVVLLCVGCTSLGIPDTSPQYKFETDYQIQNSSFTGSGYFFTETENSFFYLDENDYIHVIDKTTMKDTFLCARPNCFHSSDDMTQTLEEIKNCVAYTHLTNEEGLSFYDGGLYIVEQSVDPIEMKSGFDVVRISVDGTSKKKVWTVTWDDDCYGSVSNLFIHRGKIYFLLIAYEMDETTKESIYRGDRIYSYDLKTGKCKKIYEQQDVIWKIYALGNHIYINWLDNEDPYNTNLIRLDLTTHETTVLDDCKWVFPVGEELAKYYVSTKEIVPGIEYSMEQRLVLSSLTGENERSYEWTGFDTIPDRSKQIQTNGELLFVMDGFVIDKKTSPQEIRVHQFASGEQMASLSVPTNFICEGSRLMWCSQDEKLILYSTMSTAHQFREEKVDWYPQFYYCNISDIGTEKFQWYEVELTN